MPPRVSIITAAFNAGAYIGQTIESVSRQTFTNWEYMIVDGGSTDDTVEIIKRYTSDSRIKLQVDTRRGRCFARNTGFAHSTGELIANIDADDLWRPDKLARQVALLDAESAAGFVYTGVELIDADGKPLRRGKAVDIRQRPLTHLLTKGNPITHSSTLFRRAAFPAGRYQDEDIVEADELIVYLRALLEFQTVGFIPEPLTLYRLHGQSGLAKISIETFRREYQRGLDRFFESPLLPPGTLQRRPAALGTMYYLSAAVGISYGLELRKCALYLLKSIWLRPAETHRCVLQAVRMLRSLFRKRPR